jgi:hypothetical protein
MNFFEAFPSDIRKPRSLKGPDLANKEDEAVGVENCDPKNRVNVLAQ